MQTKKKQKKVYALFDDWGSLVLVFNSVKKAYDYVNNPENRKCMYEKVSYQYFARQIQTRGSYYFSVNGIFGHSNLSKNRIESVTFY